MKIFRYIKYYIYIVILLIVISLIQYDVQRSLDYHIIDSPDYDYYATYSLGKVYIGNHSYIEEIKKQAVYNDILIIDARNMDDPDMQILSSYEVNDAIIQSEIIAIMLDYEQEYPSHWKRSSRTMKVEWFIHNFLHNVHYERSHTSDVDFNNRDEERYNIKHQIKKRIKRLIEKVQ